jgi:hypothetical protein
MNSPIYDKQFNPYINQKDVKINQKDIILNQNEHTDKFLGYRQSLYRHSLYRHSLYNELYTYYINRMNQSNDHYHYCIRCNNYQNRYICAFCLPKLLGSAS